MTVVMRVWRAAGIASPRSLDDKADMIADVVRSGGALGEYICDCDVDALGGFGLITFTHDRNNAKRFKDQAAAFEFWRRQSRVKPLRPDGKPNRPLTAYNVTFEELR